MTMIQLVERFTYRGKEFPTEDEAIDYAESLVADAIKPAILGQGFTVSEWVKIAQTIIAHKGTLRDLLDY
jgi:hypothetical protein